MTAAKNATMRCWGWLLVLLVGGLASAAERPVGPRAERSLNGQWQFVRVSSLDAPVPEKGWQTVAVPVELRGYNYERAWFRRVFRVPSQWRGRRVLLRFGGVKFNSRVLVNGLSVGGCFNGYDAFELDITEAVRFGQPNTVLVGVHDWTGVFTGEPVAFRPGMDGHALRAAPRDRVLAPIGGRFYDYGIWDDVTLVAVPAVRISRLLVRPLVRQRRLVLHVTVVNQSDRSFAGLVEGRIFEWDGRQPDDDGLWPVSGRPVTTVGPVRVNLQPEATTQTALRLSDPPLEFWWPHRPKLYVLELRLTPVAGPPDRGRAGPAGHSNQDARPVDVLRERFGYRQLWTDGGDFVLNGRKVHLLASSWWPPAEPLSRDEIVSQLQALKRMNAVCFRTHTQPWRQRWYRLADEVGLMMIPEGAVWNDDNIYRVDDARFWQNYAAHLTAMVRHLYNHPSVVMWSLENEFYGSRAKDGTPVEHELARLGRLVKQLDPTRPILYESDGDPDGVADVIGLHYPNQYPQRRLWPNDAYWMDKPRLVHGGGGMFWDGKPFFWDRSKPLYIGEYLWVPSRDPSPHTLFFGDDAYRDHRTYRTRGKALAWRMQILAYRHYGVSGHSPWTVIEQGALDETNPCWVAQRDLYQPLAAYVRQFDSRFWSAETVERTVELFNDTMADQPAVTFRWSLLDGERELTSGQQTLALPSGAHRELPIHVPLPSVRSRRRFTLRLTLTVRGQERFRRDWPMDVFPRPTAWSSLSEPLSLVDPAGTLAKRWRRDERPFRLLQAVDEWDGRGVLVVGPKALKSVRRAERDGVLCTIGGPPGLERSLAARVAAGGCVLVLEQTPEASNWLPVRLTTQSSTLAFPLQPSHPVLRGLNVDDFRWWRGDHLVSHNEPLRPDTGGAQALVVTGGPDGLSHAPLVEVAEGRGRWLVCQLDVVRKLDTEPVARLLLERMLCYLDQVARRASERTSVEQEPATKGAFDDAASPFAASEATPALCFGPEPLRRQLTALDLDWQPLDDWRQLQQTASRLLVLQADGRLVAEHADELKAFLSRGGHVFWHRPTADGFDAAAERLELTAGAVDATGFRGWVRKPEGHNWWLDAVTREDLFWVAPEKRPAWYVPARPAEDVVETLFPPHLKQLAGQTVEAEKNVELQGDIVQVRDGEVVFATVGQASWKLQLSRSGRHLLGLRARGTPLAGQFPVAEVRLDGQPVGRVYVCSRQTRLYVLPFRATAGAHELTVRFVNDKSSPTEDRNLFVDSLVVAPDTGQLRWQPLTDPPTLVRVPVRRGDVWLCGIRWENVRKARRLVSSLLGVLGARRRPAAARDVLEAEWLQPGQKQAWFRRASDHVYLGSNGFVEGQVDVVQAGHYRVLLWAKGTPAGGAYPEVVLEWNGRPLARFHCASDDWAPQQAEVDLPRGRATVRLRFVNDLFEPPQDRNVWLDRLEFVRER